MAKRILAVSLVVAMLLTSLIIPTAAAVSTKTVDGVEYTVVSNEADFLANISLGKNIMLGADITLTAAKASKTMNVVPGAIIDGAGHTLFYSGERSSALINFNPGTKLAPDARTSGTCIVRNINFGSAESPIILKDKTGLFSVSTSLGNELIVENVNFYVYKKGVTDNSGAIFAKASSNMTFRNCQLDVEMTDIKGGTLHGGWFGEVVTPAQVELHNCLTTGTIVAPAGAAGFAAQVTTGNLQFYNCKNFASVTAPMYAAGFVANIGLGGELLTITDCVNYGTITSTGKAYDSIAAGFLARMSNRAAPATSRLHALYRCTNYGTIVSGMTAGGVVGRTHDSDFETKTYLTAIGCVNVGNVTGAEWAGGIVGVSSPMSYAVEMDNSVNIGVITATTGYAGNIAGILAAGSYPSAPAEGHIISVKNSYGAGMVVAPNGQSGAIAGKTTGTYKIGAGSYAGRACSIKPFDATGSYYCGTLTELPAGVTKIETANISQLTAALTGRLGTEVMAADAGDTTAYVVLAAPVLRGVQLSPVKDNQFALRLVAGTYASSSYGSYGFEVVVTAEDGTSTTNTYNATVMGTSVKEKVGGAIKTIEASSIAAKYLYGEMVPTLPANGEVTVKVTPVATSKDGSKTYTGTAKILTVVNGKVTNETMSINGALLDNFAIVWAKTNTMAEKTLAKHLHQQIAELTGYDLPVTAEGGTHQRAYEIRIGTFKNTTPPAGRIIAPVANSSSITITGDTTAQLGEAVTYFIELLKGKVDASDNVLTVSSPIVAPVDTKISVMSFNMGAKDNTVIKRHEWDLLVEYLPDIFTAQEPWAGFLDDFCNQYAVRPDSSFKASTTDDDVMDTDVDNKAFTGKDYYGIYWGMPRWVPGGLNNQGKASYSAIFYAKDRFTVNEAKSGTFWFSATPDVVGSKIDGSSHPRCATYATLTDVNTGEEFVVVNVHYDHVARMKEQAEVLISELIARVGRDTTMIITGDMNSKLDSAAIQYMINNETMPLTSVDLMASESYRNDAVAFGIIDWIFSNTPDRLEVNNYRFCKDFNMFNNLWNSSLAMGMPSDHPAVYTEFTIKPRT